MTSLTLFSLLAKKKTNHEDDEDLDVALQTPVPRADGDDAILLTPKEKGNSTKQQLPKEKEAKHEKKRDHDRHKERDHDRHKEKGKPEPQNGKGTNGKTRTAKVDDRHEDRSGWRNGKGKDWQDHNDEWKHSKGPRNSRDQDWQDTKASRNTRDEKWQDWSKDSKGSNHRQEGDWQDRSQVPREPDNRTSHWTSSKSEDSKDTKQQAFKVTIDETGWQDWSKDDHDKVDQDWTGKDRDRHQKNSRVDDWSRHDDEDYQDWSGKDRDRRQKSSKVDDWSRRDEDVQDWSGKDRERHQKGSKVDENGWQDRSNHDRDRHQKSSREDDWRRSDDKVYQDWSGKDRDQHQKRSKVDDWSRDDDKVYQDWSGKDRDRHQKNSKVDDNGWQDRSNHDRDRHQKSSKVDDNGWQDRSNHDRDVQHGQKKDWSRHDRDRQDGQKKPSKGNENRKDQKEQKEQEKEKTQQQGKAAGKNGSMEGLKGLIKRGGKVGAQSSADDDDEDNPGPEENRRVFFNHVPWRTPEEHLRELFETCGNIVSFELWLREDGRSLGMGCVIFSTARGADTAVDKLRRRYVHGRTMYVSKKKPSAQQVAAEVKKTCSLMEKDGIPASLPQNSDLNELLQNFPIGPAESSDDEFIDEDVNFDEPDPRRVFFSNLSFKTSEGFLRSKFEDAGHVISFELWRQGNGKSLGKGCAEFDSVGSAQNCVKLFDGKRVDERPISVVPDPRPRGNPKARVFFHNVCWTSTEKTLRSKFEEFGPLKTFELRVKWDGRSLGMGCCEYESPSDAASAIRWLNGTEIEGRTIYVSEFNRSGA